MYVCSYGDTLLLGKYDECLLPRSADVHVLILVLVALVSRELEEVSLSNNSETANATVSARGCGFKPTEIILSHISVAKRN